MSVFIDEDGNAISRSFMQPTVSVDAEPVAWLYKEGRALYGLYSEPRPGLVAGGLTEIPLYTEAQMQAQVDAARREALEQLNAALEIIDEAYRKYGVEFDAEDISAAQRCRDFWLAALKENPNAG